MLQLFKTYLKKENLFSNNDKILLTVSGGVDSVVMCSLFHKANINFGIAHCNFKLRGKESDTDEQFVEELAEKYKVPFHTTEFNTADYAKKNNLSIQVAARELRYNWFDELQQKFNYDYIATAHHQDDSIETFFINFIRGTGISGMHGILPKHNKIIRPLLFCNKEQIIDYAQANKILFREDSSNASDKYIRNKIRHKILPVLKELNPKIEATANNNLNHLRQVEAVYKKAIEDVRKKVTKKKQHQIYISIPLLNKHASYTPYLFEILKPFNFNEATVNDIINNIEAKSGKLFFSSTHRLIKDRTFLIVEELKPNNNKSIEKNTVIDVDKKVIKTKLFKLSFTSQIRNPKSEIIKSPSIAQLDYDKLTFPLEIRKWEKGDTFYPLGMKNKKKLSDFFINQKLSIAEKENVWLLISDKKIAWVIGKRIDNRFKITPQTKNIYTIRVSFNFA